MGNLLLSIILRTRQKKNLFISKLIPNFGRIFQEASVGRFRAGEECNVI